MGIILEKSGLLTTVQDLGRYGYQNRGITVNGAMDSLSMGLANLLVGNDVHEPVLEITLIGPSLRFTVPTYISICGANFSPSINNMRVPMDKPIVVKEGDVLTFGKYKYGCRAYVAFRGGIGVSSILGSKSTCIPAGYGGFNGRKLEKGDVLPIKSISNKRSPLLNWSLSSYYNKILFSDKPIRFLKGKQYDLFDDKSILLFHTTMFTLSKDANRMGYRFEGAQLKLEQQLELLTEGVTVGTVQIPPSGQPIILMADRQTTGGYPKIAQIASVDLPRLAQLIPGDSISFKEIDLPSAHQLAVARENGLRALSKILKLKWKESE